MKTRNYVSAHGRIIETEIEIPINDKKQFSISTMKRFNGNVSSNVIEESIDGNFKRYSFGDYSETLVSEKIRATEKAMLNQHQRAIEMFINSEKYLASK